MRTKESPPNRLRVLAVEDDADTSTTLAVLLRLSGHEVQVAADGPAALQAAGEREPDVVLLDIGLPGMDGYEVARRLRSRESGRRPLLVAVTGRSGDEDIRRSEGAGIDLHLVKPVDPRLLRHLLARCRRALLPGD